MAVTTAARADTGGVADDPFCTDISTPASVTVGLFAKTPVLSVAEREGFLAAQHLNVGYYTVKSSTDQFTQLAAGATPLIVTAVDNIANYRLNTSNALGHTLPVTSIAGLDGGYNLQLFTQPSVPSIEALRGKVLGVDASNSGFAFVAYDILAQHGLAAPTKGTDGKYTSTDYGVAEIGGVGGRFLNMTGKLPAQPVDATLLNQGFDILGAHAGLTGTDDVRSVTDPYLSGVVAGQDSWLQDNHCTAVRYVRALARAAAFTTDPANASAVIADITADEPPAKFLDPAYAEGYAQALYGVTMTPGIGQFSTVDVPRDGLRNVLALRAKYDGFDTPQNVDLLTTPAGGLYQAGVVHDALHDAPQR